MRLIEQRRWYGMSMKTLFSVLFVLQVQSILAWGISPTSKDIGVNGGSFTLEITNQGSFDYTRGASDSWITIEGDKVKVAKNTENIIHGRVGYVQVNAYRSGSAHNYQNLDGSSRCYIFQYGQGASFSPTAVSLPGTNVSSRVSVYVDSGISWVMRSSQDWLSVKNGTGTGSKTITIEASENTTGVARSAIVQIHDANGDPSITYNDDRIYYVTVTQGVPPERYTITYENTRGAENPNPTNYYKGSSVAFEALSSAVDGYVFSGWTPAQISEVDSGDKVVTASWTPINYTIAYDANGGDGEMEKHHRWWFEHTIRYR